MNNIIFILCIAFIVVFLLFFGLQAIYYGIFGLIKKKIPLFLKEYFSTNKNIKKLDTKNIQDVDVATGNYAIFWSIIYLLIGTLLSLSAAFIVYFIIVSLFR